MTRGVQFSAQPSDLKHSLSYLVPGNWYVFERESSGDVVGKFVKQLTTEQGEFLEVLVLTAQGSGQERHKRAVIYLRGGKRPACWTPRRFKLEKVGAIRKINDQEWWENQGNVYTNDYDILRQQYLEDLKEGGMPYKPAARSGLDPVLTRPAYKPEKKGLIKRLLRK